MFVFLQAGPLAADPSQVAPKVIEFKAVPIADALRQLAKGAGIKLVIDDAIKDTVTIRLDDASPMDALQIIVQAKNLYLNESRVGGFYFVESPRTHALKLGDLESGVFPEAIARYKRRLFEALRREGFNDEQALTIVAAERTPVVEVPIFKPAPVLKP